jgi:hypothetical protein
VLASTECPLTSLTKSGQGCPREHEATKPTKPKPRVDKKAEAPRVPKRRINGSDQPKLGAIVDLLLRTLVIRMGDGMHDSCVVVRHCLLRNLIILNNPRH